MLTLTRKAGESIRIGNDVVLVIQEIRGKTVKISIEAPKGVPIYREEVYQKIVLANLESIETPLLDDLQKLPDLE
jgi:carbon storage regulator